MELIGCRSGGTNVWRVCSAWPSGAAGSIRGRRARDCRMTAVLQRCGEFGGVGCNRDNQQDLRRGGRGRWRRRRGKNATTRT